MRQAQKVIQAIGPVVRDKWQQVKVNPACAVARDARAGMMAALKALNLDIEQVHDRPGRPGGR